MWFSFNPGVCSGTSRIVNGLLGDARWIRYNRLIITIYSYGLLGINKMWCTIAAIAYPYLALFSAVDGFASGEHCLVVFWSLFFSDVHDLLDVHDCTMTCILMYVILLSVT